VMVAPPVRAPSTRRPGGFGWDTVPGFYEIEASKPGCGRIVTPPFQVPPPQAGIEIVLHCTAGFHVEIDTLPGAKRSIAYSVQLEASGGTGPHKWKKTARLPKGLKLIKTGQLSGIPSKKLAPVSYSISVQAQDGARHKATLTLEVT
jgi:hypothetical protein